MPSPGSILATRDIRVSTTPTDLATQGVERYRMYIDGRWLDSTSGSVIRSMDPFEESDWAEVPDGDESDVDLAVRAARRAFDGGPWSSMTGVERGRLMRRLAALLEERGEDIARSEVRDNGKVFREMSAQLTLVPEWFYYFGGAADKIEGKVLPSSKANFLIYSVQEPVGVVGAITPWNSPTFILSYKLAPALAAGCTFVLKPSEHAPVSALKFAELVDEAGFPPGVFNVVSGRGPSAGAPLASHPMVDKVTFTGSTSTGVQIARNAAGHVTPVSLELGGKSPNIVFADADLDAATDGVIAGIFAAAGQSCLAGSRLLVQRSVHDEVVDRVVERARRIQLGNPMLPETEMGPLAFPGQLTKALRYVELGQEEGATLATGGRRPEQPSMGLFFEPTVLVNVRNDMRVAREEVFGPVLCVIPFEDEGEALALANDSSFGLGAGVWTTNIQRGHRMAKSLEVGTVWVNAYRLVSFDIPFGGYKMSGYGRDNGLESIREYLRQKSVWLELSGGTRDPFRVG
jgi:acyl-CoA reductase-like NAD-dependent aldehyde dehydrogenase